VATTPGLVTAKLSLAKVAKLLLRNASTQGCVKPASSACCTKVASESKMEEAAIARLKEARIHPSPKITSDTLHL
jgi:hypothetical protein